jgi:PAS domain S-box-containing protein
MSSKKDNAKQPPQNVTDIILESISDGVFTVDHNWRIMSFNRAAEEITGISRQEAIGRHCWEVFRSNMCEENCALRRTMKEGRSVVNSVTYIINSTKKRIPISAATSLLRDEEGQVLGGVEIFRDLSLVEELRKELKGRYKVGDMVSRSPLMHAIFNILPQIAQSQSTVLIEGETGTGKELLARAIHSASPRKDRPFIAVNCGALPDTLLESELFGYKAGAFTNATKDKPGRFQMAEGGTILLDEIGDTSAAFQVKLLRVIEEMAFQPLGSTKPINTDIRIIAATNHDLSMLVEKGRFRRDLYYRINVVRLTPPALRGRMEDIPLLIEHFIEKMNRLHGKAVAGMDPRALEILMNHDYPGNIRELENIIEHAFVLCTGDTILQRHLPSSLESPAHKERLAPPEKGFDQAVASAGARTILEALKRNRYNRSAAAKELGIHKSTLFRKIKKLNLSLPSTDGRHSRS